MKRFKGELTDIWDFETLKKLFIEEFLIETTLLAKKEEFMLIKLIKRFSLMDFTHQFYEKAQFLKYHGHLLLIDAKNAVF